MMKSSALGSQMDVTEITNDKMRAMIDRKVQQIEAGFELKVSNLKPLLLDHACDFIKEQTQNVTKLLTRQHHETVRQFLDFKERSEEALKQAEKDREDMKYLE